MHFSLHSQKSKFPRNAIFLDRDGTINIEKNYLYRTEDWEWIPGAIEAIKKFKQAGFLLVVVTNQAGIARGLYSSEDVERLHSYVQDELFKIGKVIDAFYYCPHHPAFTDLCSCRKPSTEMLRHAATELNINLKTSWMIGDKLIDVEAGKALGVNTLMVRTGHGKVEERQLVSSDKIDVVDTLIEAAEHIISATG